MMHFLLGDPIPVSAIDPTTNDDPPDDDPPDDDEEVEDPFCSNWGDEDVAGNLFPDDPEEDEPEDNE